MLPGLLSDSTTMAAIVSLSGSVNSGITRDLTKLDAAISGIAPNAIFRSSGTNCPELDFYEADLIVDKDDPSALADATQRLELCQPNTPPNLATRLAASAARQKWSAGQQRIRVTYANIGQYVQRMARLPGQRILLLVSPGFLPLGQEGGLEESHAIDLASGAGVIISALDARGVYTRGAIVGANVGMATAEQEQASYARTSAMIAGTAMGALADGTGGDFFQNDNDLAAGLRLLAAAPETVYLLELPLDGVKRNGVYHSLKVKVDRDGVGVEARRGYFAPNKKRESTKGLQLAVQRPAAEESALTGSAAQGTGLTAQDKVNRPELADAMPPLHPAPYQGSPVAAAAPDSAPKAEGAKNPPDVMKPTAMQTADRAEGFIHLDVVVTDKAGRAATGLSAGDFEVLDNGQSKTIHSFTEFHQDDAVPVILVLDTLEIPDDLARAERAAAIAFLREDGGRLPHPTSVFSITTAGLWLMANPSQDGNRLADDLQHSRGEGLVRPFGNALPREPGIRPAPAFEALQALGQIAAAERRLPGRKLLLWLGPGAGRGSDAYGSPIGPKSDTFFTICWFSILMRDAQLTIDSLSAGESDPQIQSYKAFRQGTTIAHPDWGYLSRKVLAVESGGQVMDRSFDLLAELNECVREAGSYYSLSFDPAPASGNEEYHTIRVTMSRSWLTARTTTGYYDEPYYSDEQRPGVQRLTVAAMDARMAMLRTQSDGAAAEQLVSLQLTARASDETLSHWETEFPGKRARVALAGLLDQAAFLPLSEDQLVADPAPDAMEQGAILARVQTYLKETIPNRPNFFARRTTLHYEEGAQYRQKSLQAEYDPLHVAETTRETVVYRHGAEIVENGGRTQNGMRPWLTTYGTFGPVLDMLHDVFAQGVMWSRWDTEAGMKVAIFRYAVPLSASHYQISGCCRPDGDGRAAFGGYTAYHGEIGIDPDTGAVLRIEAVADLNGRVPLDEGGIVVQYGPVEIGGKTYICPLHSVSLWRSLSESTLQNWDEKFLTWGPYETTVNDIRYSDYHMFRAKVRILPGPDSTAP